MSCHSEKFSSSAVFWHQWCSLLHTSDSRTSRCWSSSLKSWYQQYLIIHPYQCPCYLVDASVYRYCHEIHGCCWKKVSALTQCTPVHSYASVQRAQHTLQSAYPIKLTFFISFIRRFLLLTTIPVLILTLVILVLSNVVDFGQVAHAVLSTISVIVYFCCFVMGFGPIPNILCSEIFPTRVRGVCIAVCALTFWIGDIIVTYTLPVMLNSIGLAGVFGIYAVVCTIALVFVFLKVPETKGMPLEVITEFFAVGAKQAGRT